MNIPLLVPSPYPGVKIRVAEEMDGSISVRAVFETIGAAIVGRDLVAGMVEATLPVQLANWAKETSLMAIRYAGLRAALVFDAPIDPYLQLGTSIKNGERTGMVTKLKKEDRDAAIQWDNGVQQEIGFDELAENLRQHWTLL